MVSEIIKKLLDIEKKLSNGSKPHREKKLLQAEIMLLQERLEDLKRLA